MSTFKTSFLNSAGSAFGGGILGGALNLGFGQLAGALNARRQWKYQKKQMQKQFELNEAAADSAQRRTEETWQKQFDAENAYNSPEAQVARLNAANLNVGTALGGSGVSGVSSMSPSTSGPMGGVSAPSGQYGPTAASSTSLADSAQAYYYMAAARKLDRETPGEGQTEDLLTAKIRSLNTQSDYARFELSIEQDLRDVTISTRKEKLANLKASTCDLLASADLRKVNAGYLQELTSQAAANTVLLNLEALLREKQIEMQEDIRQEVKARIVNYYSSAAQSRALSKYYEREAEQVRSKSKASIFRDYAVGSAQRQNAAFTKTARGLLKPKFVADVTDRAVGRLLQQQSNGASVVSLMLGVPGLSQPAQQAIKSAGDSYFTSELAW